LSDKNREAKGLDSSRIGEVYEKLYDQFVDVKRLTFAMAGLHRKPDAVAALISEEIHNMAGVKNNAVWLLSAPSTLEEKARNGVATPVDQRRTIDWNSSDEIRNLMVDQRVLWGPFRGEMENLFSEFEAPVVFPIKGSSRALGFLILEQSDQLDAERCQHIAGFSSLILEMSDLYFRLKEEIRERQALEILLIKERNRAQTYLDVAEVILVALDKEGKVELINRKGCQILGYPSDEIIGKNWFECFTTLDDRQFLKSVLSNIMDHDAESARYLESGLINASGATRLVAWRNTRVTDDEGQVVGTFSSGEDITDRARAEQEKRALQKQLFQSQKMEALGTLVGGIAHDFNNMLQIILGYSQLLLDDQKNDDPGYKDLQTIIETVEGGADLVRKLLAFGRQAPTFPVFLDLNHQIMELTRLISGTLPQIVKIDFDLTHGPVTIHADPNQIDQVVMNLAINASEAMPTGGRLKIATTTVSLDEEYCRTHHGVKPGNYLMLSVSDTGCGMDEKTISRIFEPFFSTKQRGATRGTGLGLSVVQGIVEQQGGHITCESEPGKGSLFKVYFPAIESQPATRKTTSPSVQLGRGELILVAEDNIPVAELAQRSLTNAGYTVITANNGSAALEVYKTRRNEISLVILDLLMPEMTGKDCLMELAKIDPSVKVIIATGFSPSDELHKEISPLVKGVVQKPFSLTELLQAVGSAIGSDQE
jgi:two-component system, cell cycle sensor histidine kinase and response regulator CckA